MFVHSAEFVRRHKKSPTRELSIFGVEKMTDTLRLCKLNLAVHGLSADIREANSYYDDPQKLVGRFDFVMANPPFNQSEVDQKRLLTEAGGVSPRFPLGLPTANNANYLWINLFYAALAPRGRAGFVMANSAADAGGSEREIRRRLIETAAVDCIVAIGPNMFYTVTLPVTLWFLDKRKAEGPRADQVLFVDARHLFRQVTRALRTFDPDHIEFLANIVRLWRGEPIENNAGSEARMNAAFPSGAYCDVPGLCYAATRAEISAQSWSLNSGRYVGVAPGQLPDDVEFQEKLEQLQEELEALNTEAAAFQGRIADNVAALLGT
jgi:type I restriction enzyme M protein